MTDPKILTDETLLTETDRLVRAEREILTVILDHLREIERRRLFCTLGFSSLFSYAVGRLGYSEDQAYRRIAAMRLVREIPEIRGELEKGEVTLTQIGIAQALFTNEKKQGRAFTAEKKNEVFQTIAGLSTREAQVKILEFAPEPPPRKDEVKAITPDRHEARVELAAETLRKMEQIKGLLAHEDPHMTFDQLVNRLCDLGLKTWNPARPSSRAPRSASRAEIRRELWRRDKGTCTNCGSIHAVQEDHITPAAMGGPYTLENLRLRCRPCNQRAAIEKLGQRKMDQHLR